MSSQLLEAPVQRPSRRRLQPSGETATDQSAPKSDLQAELIHAYSPDARTWKNIDWTVVVWMPAMHIGCVTALFFFSWEALAVAVVLHWLTCSIGICMGYHRFLSHRSLKLVGPARFLVTLCGVLAGEGTPLTWAANHRVHHARSDRKGDPHSPNNGSWWSHIIWLFLLRDRKMTRKIHRRYVPDLLDDPIMVFFEKTFGLWLIGSGVALFAIGGWSWLLWGFCARLVFAYHSTWFVNSATHIWGYRNYETTDRSRNLWWVALLAYGEGWHNNHHAHPRLARAGHKWWEIDMTFYAIRGLQWLGLAYEVHDQIPTGTQAAPDHTA